MLLFKINQYKMHSPFRKKKKKKRIHHTKCQIQCHTTGFLNRPFNKEIKNITASQRNAGTRVHYLTVFSCFVRHPDSRCSAIKILYFPIISGAIFHRDHKTLVFEGLRGYFVLYLYFSILRVGFFLFIIGLNFLL